jgi:hypothetical protein
MLLYCAAPVAAAEVDLHLTPVSPVIKPSTAFGLELIATASEEEVTVSVVTLPITWDEEIYELIMFDTNGDIEAQYIGLPTTADCGINDDLDDGDGYLRIWANFGDPFPVSTEGTSLGTFVFRTGPDEAEDVPVDLVTAIGMCDAVVIDGVIPGLDILDDMTGATVDINKNSLTDPYPLPDA